MPCHQLIGNRQQVKGVVMDRLTKRTGDDVVAIAGKRGILTGKIHERHGIACEHAENNLVDCEASSK